MTWEETIQFIRTKPEFSYLVEKAYLEKDLKLNVERFKESEEYLETLQTIKKYAPQARNILDVGSGNGISVIAFALDGYEVVATEPDASDTIGAGAIRKLKEEYSLSNVTVFEEFAENINYAEGSFDVIYVRQAMHHAYDLNQFVANLAHLLKKGGIFLTVRDHVIYDKSDKDWFLKSHPLQSYYGGENAFLLNEYLEAFKKSGLSIALTLRYYDSVINYAPMTVYEFNTKPQIESDKIKRKLAEKLGIFAKFPFVETLYKRKIKFSKSNFFKEEEIPGRIYSFLAIKQ